MNGEFEGIVGYFASEEALSRAIERARSTPHTDLEPYLPVGDPDLLDEALPGTSPVRWMALAGGLAGIAAGLWMTISTSLDYPLVTGGKPIIALPPYLAVAFVLMILFAAIGTVLGFLLFARLPSLTPSSAYRRDLAVDRFGLLVRCPPAPASAHRVEEALREAGALEVRRVYREARGPLGEVP
jgi:hypothetical protein